MLNQLAFQGKQYQVTKTGSNAPLTHVKRREQCRMRIKTRKAHAQWTHVERTKQYTDKKNTHTRTHTRTHTKAANAPISG